MNSPTKQELVDQTRALMFFLKMQHTTPPMLAKKHRAKTLLLSGRFNLNGTPVKVGREWVAAPPTSENKGAYRTALKFDGSFTRVRSYSCTCHNYQNTLDEPCKHVLALAGSVIRVLRSQWQTLNTLEGL